VTVEVNYSFLPN